MPNTPSKSVLLQGDEVSYVAFPVTISNPNTDLDEVRIKLKHPTLADAYWATNGYANPQFYDEFNKVVKMADGSYVLVARVVYVPPFLSGSRAKPEFFEPAPAPVESDVFVGSESSNPTIDVFIYS